MFRNEWLEIFFIYYNVVFVFSINDEWNLIPLLFISIVKLNDVNSINDDDDDDDDKIF